MTARLLSPEFAGSKKILEDQLNRDAKLVRFDNPTPWADNLFTGDQIKLGDGYVIVMDPLTRRRFAKVFHKSNGTFVVR